MINMRVCAVSTMAFLFGVFISTSLGSDSKLSRCLDRLEDIPKESPIYLMMSTICKVVETMKNSPMGQNETETDERIFLAVVLRHRNLVLTEKEAGSGQFVTTDLFDLPGGIAVDYDPVEGYMYCTSNGIFKAKLDGSNYQQLFNSTQTGEGIAIDWVSRNMYWTEDQYIKVSRLDGTNQKIILDNDTLDEPRAIAVDPSRGFIYWSDWGTNPKIGSARIDGSYAQTIVDDDIKWPNGMALDIERNTIYWGDAGTDKVSSVNLESGLRETLPTGYTPHIFGFSYVDDYIYWTDWRTNNVERFNVSGTSLSNHVSKLSKFGQPFGIKATKLYPPSDITNPCAKDNGGCKHLCFYTPEGTRCGCEDGWTLGEGGNCVEN